MSDIQWEKQYLLRLLNTWRVKVPPILMNRNNKRVISASVSKVYLTNLDHQRLVYLTYANEVQISAGLREDFETEIINYTATACTITAASGVTFTNAAAVNQIPPYSMVKVVAVAPNTYILVGNFSVKYSQFYHVFPITLEGADLGVAATLNRVYLPFSGMITGIRAFVTTASSGADIIARILINSSAITASSVVIQDGDTIDAGDIELDGTPSFSPSDYFEFEILQVGSIIKGKGLKMSIIGYKI